MKNLKKDKTKAKTTKQQTPKQQPHKPAVEILDLPPDDAQAERVSGGGTQDAMKRVLFGAAG